MYSDGPGEPPTEHDSLSDYVCHAFPDDAYITDQFFVGLISVAVALPVDMLLVRLFEASNEGDAPEQWLDAPSGTWRLLLGSDSWKAWNYDAGVSDLVKWQARRGAEALPSALLRLAAWLAAAARRAFGGGDDDAKAKAKDGGGGHGDGDDSDDGVGFHEADARAEAWTKRCYAFSGLLGVYVVWAAFSWVIFTYGMLIYRQLGDKAQQEFAKVRVARCLVCSVPQPLTPAPLCVLCSLTDLGRGLLAEQRVGVAGGVQDRGQNSARPGHPGHAARDQGRAVVRGARCACAADAAAARGCLA